MEEIWKNIRGTYEVSDLGNVRNTNYNRTGKSKVLKQNRDGKGNYLMVSLCIDGIVKRYSVHRLVWEAFNGEIPEGMEVNHINEITTDNRLDNLNLLTHCQNVRYGTGIKRRAKTQRTTQNCKPILQYTLDGVFIKEWPSLEEIRRITGYHPYCITNCCKGKQNKAYNYIWKYKEC